MSNPGKFDMIGFAIVTGGRMLTASTLGSKTPPDPSVKKNTYPTSTTLVT